MITESEINFVIELVVRFITTIIQILIVAVISVLVHELGHYIMAKIYRANPRFKWDGINPTIIHDTITDKWKGVSINLAGVFTGILSIILLSRYIESDGAVFFLLLGMIIASSYDIANAMYRIKHKDE